MNSVYYQLFSWLFAITAQTVGVIALVKAIRGLAWWLMAIGMVASVVGFVDQALFLLTITSGGGHYLSAVSGYLPRALGEICWSAGVLLFALGFTLHVVRFARVDGRAAELELLAAAQAEELARVRAD